ncbi:hypothetical protein [Oscillatoria sp. HE19RPO]|uniref:hypothetical protein n=1 Tax=Oscillatoria sp. HE19RPO TaxID=2954806 RepID=UPI0020C2B6E9|nr:hypothetical protein [Oscillatoria sp. HE19RPO]
MRIRLGILKAIASRNKRAIACFNSLQNSGKIKPVQTAIQSMTRFIHDQFAKQYLEELLSPFGTVETGKTIAAEVQEVDVLFIANPESNRDRSSLGLLGQIAGNQSIFEPFRNAVQPKQIRSCLAKLYAIQSNEERKANRENNPLPEEEVITGWILTPTASTSLLDYFGATEDPIIGVKGVYSLARASVQY